MRVALFIDGSNYFYMTKNLEWDVDYKRLLTYCSKYGEVVDAYYYTGSLNDNSQNSFFNALQSFGYAVKTKPVKTIIDNDSGSKHQKANLDIEIALDMINYIDNYDIAVLASGDGDFKSVLELVKSRGKSFEIISANSTMAKELREICGMHYTDISHIRNSIEKIR